MRTGNVLSGVSLCVPVCFVRVCTHVCLCMRVFACSSILSFATESYPAHGLFFLAWFKVLLQTRASPGVTSWLFQPPLAQQWGLTFKNFLLVAKCF